MTNPTHSNIVNVFNQANALDITEGATWYSRAFKIADTIADDNGITVEQAAGVIAALSPNNRWERNVQDAQNIVRAYMAGGAGAASEVKVCTYGKMRQKAIDILTLSSREESRDILDILNGRKIKAFFACIVGIADIRAQVFIKANEALDVCVDGHAYGIWQGERMSMKDVPNIGVKLYLTVAAQYRAATDQINRENGTDYTPSQIQAVTWVTWRRLHDV